MKIEKEDVKEIVEYDAEKFAEWLLQGFSDMRDENREVTAFYPLNRIVGRGRDRDIIEGLKNIYETLSYTQKRDFRKGITISLSKELRQNYPLRSLLHLAGRIHANEILPVVNRWIKNKSLFLLKDASERKEFFALTLDIVSGMSPADGVTHTIQLLIGAKNLFLDGYAPMAFIALCRATPEKFLEHLNLLRGSFLELHREKGEKNAFITAKRFVHYVPIEIITEKLWQMKEADKWLVKALFVGDEAPLQITVIK